MTSQILRRAVLAPVVLVGLMAWAPAPAASSQPKEGEKSLFVGALDETGKPVPGLTADDFRLREDGTDREITGAGPAKQPLQIELLIDTSDAASQFTHDIRVAASSFVHEVLKQNPDASIRLMEFGQAAITVVPFSSSAEALDGGINKLVARPTTPSVLIEALIEANKDLAKRPSTRRAIVSLNLEPANEASTEDPRQINEALKTSGAQLWAVSLQGNQNTATSNKVGSTKGSGGVNTRDIGLPQLAKNSGGDRNFIVAQSAMETALVADADALAGQYEITYKRPGSKQAKVVQVGTVRTGLKLHASGYAPQ